MSQQEVWKQESFADLTNDAGKEGKEALSYYVIPEGTVVWPQKFGHIIDRYRGVLTKDVLATLVLEEAENKRKKELLWELVGTIKKLPDGSIVAEGGATLYFGGRYWQIESGSVFATGRKLKFKKINDYRR